MSSSTLPVAAILEQYIAMESVSDGAGVWTIGTTPDPTRNISNTDAGTFIAALQAMLGGKLTTAVQFGLIDPATRKVDTRWLIPNPCNRISVTDGVPIPPTIGLGTESNPGDCVDAANSIDPGVITPGWPISATTPTNQYMWITTVHQLVNGNLEPGDPVLVNIQQLRGKFLAYKAAPTAEAYNDLAAIFPLTPLTNSQQAYLEMVASQITGL